jgi:transcriptional regulator GlxA family with amidase domain
MATLQRLDRRREMASRRGALERAQVLVYDGADELDVVAPFEILAAGGFEVELASLGSRQVRTAHGMTLRADGLLDPAPDLLVVPGGGWLSRSAEGAWAEVQRGVAPEAIARRHAAGTVVAAVCSGVMIVAASGLLAGRPAVTHHGALEELAGAGALVSPDARVVDDGDLLTAGGVTSAIDLALHIVRSERGEEAAAAGARRIEHEPRGPVLAAATTA